MPAVSGEGAIVDKILPLLGDKRVAPNKALTRCPPEVCSIHVDRREPNMLAHRVHGAAGAYDVFKESP